MFLTHDFSFISLKKSHNILLSQCFTPKMSSSRQKKLEHQVLGTSSSNNLQFTYYLMRDKKNGRWRRLTLSPLATHFRFPLSNKMKASRPIPFYATQLGSLDTEKQHVLMSNFLIVKIKKKQQCFTTRESRNGRTVNLFRCI